MHLAPKADQADPKIDLAIESPSMRAPVVPGAKMPLRVHGVASTIGPLRRGNVTEEVTALNIDETVEQLEGVPMVSADYHERWSKDPTIPIEAEGAVTRAEAVNGEATFRATITNEAAKADILSGKTPDVSIGYVTDDQPIDGDPRHVVQTNRRIHHLARVPAGRCPGAYIKIDTGEEMIKIDAAPAAGSLDALLAFIEPYLSNPDAVMLIRAKLPPAEEETAEVVVDAKAPPDSVPAMPPALAAKVDALTKERDAFKGRAEAAEAIVEQGRQAARTQRAAAQKTAMERAGIKVDGFDAAAPTDAMLSAADRALADHVLTASAPGVYPTHPPKVDTVDTVEPYKGPNFFAAAR